MQPPDLCPMLHCDHSLTLTEGVNIHPAPEGQFSRGVDSWNGSGGRTPSYGSKSSWYQRVSIQRSNLRPTSRSVPISS